MEKNKEFVKVNAESKHRRVAKFLILIGAERASEILKQLDPEQVKLISNEIATIRGVNAADAAGIMQEFTGIFSESARLEQNAYGGVETARRILHGAFGAEKGDALLHKSVPASMASPFSFLEDYPETEIAGLLQNETPALEAMVLTRMRPESAAKVLSYTDPERKAEIAKRIAHRGEVSPEVIRHVAESLQKKAEKLEKVEEQAVDGASTLAAILRASGSSIGSKILDDLTDKDPILSEQIRSQVHKLDDIEKADDKPLQDKLREMDDKDIVLLLKGKSPGFTEKILSNISAGHRSQIREEENIMGPVSQWDIDVATSQFLIWFREKRQKGEILLIDDDDIIRD
ncbi:flagellar motor switch protein FliG [Spirochaetia bacterium]|nr:flagellar motor switch protein FliG [Spirochaetia bacterium]